MAYVGGTEMGVERTGLIGLYNKRGFDGVTSNVKHPKLKINCINMGVVGVGVSNQCGGAEVAV
jgi:hypothetical protein